MFNASNRVIIRKVTRNVGHTTFTHTHIYTYTRVYTRRGFKKKGVMTGGRGRIDRSRARFDQLSFSFLDDRSIDRRSSLPPPCAIDIYIYTYTYIYMYIAQALSSRQSNEVCHVPAMRQGIREKVAGQKTRALLSRDRSSWPQPPIYTSSFFIRISAAFMFVRAPSGLLSVGS